MEKEREFPAESLSREMAFVAPLLRKLQCCLIDIDVECDMLQANDKITKTTLAMRVDGITGDKVIAHIANSRARFGFDLYGRAL